jgi:indole-3-glycerol phosphate synthase
MNILNQIVETKRLEIDALKKQRTLHSLKEEAMHQPQSRNFKAVIIQKSKLAIIGELKQASPSRGLIRDTLDVKQFAKSYEEAGVQALSVLTDATYFHGQLSFLRQAKEACHLPVLRKDFILDEYQVYESKIGGADAILLIVSILSEEQLKYLNQLASTLGMVALIEIHNSKELTQALQASPEILGINNRNLATFQVDLKISEDLIPQCPRNIPVVSESGIFNGHDARRMKQAGAAALLVGEAMMTAADLRSLVPQLQVE